jgi:hypothetical protein
VHPASSSSKEEEPRLHHRVIYCLQNIHLSSFGTAQNHNPLNHHHNHKLSSVR